MNLLNRNRKCNLLFLFMFTHTALAHAKQMQREIIFLLFLFTYLFEEKHVAHSLHIHVPVWTEGWKQRIKKTPAGYFFLTQFVLSCCNNISVLTHRHFCTFLNFTEKIEGVRFNHLPLQKDWKNTLLIIVQEYLVNEIRKLKIRTDYQLLWHAVLGLV